MNDNFDAIVIGSGLGGLTAGALFARAGQKVLVLEQNDAFGGAATTYHRGGMTVEVSLHETTDPRKSADPKGEVFEALGLYGDIEFVPIEAFYEVRCPLIGAPFVIPHGIEALRDRLVARFPDQAASIRHFVRQIESIQSAMRFLAERHDGLWWAAHGAELPIRLWSVLRWVRASLSEVFGHYFGDHEAIKIALAANLPYYADDPDRMWWLAYAVAQGGYFHGGGHYLKGGSQVLSNRLVDRIRESGGEALAGRTVVEVQLGEHGEVSGVRYRSQKGGGDAIAKAPVVFANASPLAVEGMLPAAERERFMAPYRGKRLSTSLFSISLGLSRRPSDLGMSAYSTAIIPKWMERLSDFKRCAELLADMPSSRLPALMVVDYSRIDSGLIGGALCPVSVVGLDRLANWAGLSDTDYNSRKGAWLESVIERLDAEWPGFGRAVAQQEMATARTMHEFLHTPGGAIYGFAPAYQTGCPYQGHQERRERRSAVCGWPRPMQVSAVSAVPWVPVRLQRELHSGITDQSKLRTLGDPSGRILNASGCAQKPCLLKRAQRCERNSTGRICTGNIHALPTQRRFLVLQDELQLVEVELFRARTVAAAQQALDQPPQLLILGLQFRHNLLQPALQDSRIVRQGREIPSSSVDNCPANCASTRTLTPSGRVISIQCFGIRRSAVTFAMLLATASRAARVMPLRHAAARLGLA
jgi:all-trans-retinol 13,14-reductase